MSNLEQEGAAKEAHDFSAPIDWAELNERERMTDVFDICKQLGYSPDQMDYIREVEDRDHQVTRALGIAERNGGAAQRDHLYDELIRARIIVKPKQGPQS